MLRSSCDANDTTVWETAILEISLDRVVRTPIRRTAPASSFTGFGARATVPRVGALTEDAFSRLVAAGCDACQSPRLTLRSYVDGRLPLMGGEPVGALTWVYDGEKFVDGLFEARCADCQHTIFAADCCPRCNATGALATILATENRWPPPNACPSCDDDEVRFVAFVPARVAYEGKRAEKARTTVELHEPGFHGFRVDCRACGTVAELVDRCPLCDAPGPLRPRP